MIKSSILAATAAIALFSAVSAQAAILKLTWTQNNAVFDTFKINTATAVDNSVGGYLYVPVFDSTNGYNGMYVGSGDTNGDTGLGFQNGNLPNVNPWLINDYFSPAFWSGTGYNLNFAAGQTYTGFLGTQISVAAVPEPASWAMLIAGFGLTGAVMRRRASRAIA